MTVPERPASAVQWARVFIRPALGNGGTAVDATAGNGQDTVFLAEGVGPEGRVYSLDIQEEALSKTRLLVSGRGLSERVKTILGGHQLLDRLVVAPVDAVMFNLGYLPGGSRAVVTAPDTTAAGIKAALSIIRPGGRISIVVYTGHPGAVEESSAVGDLLSGLEEREFSVQRMVFWNSRKKSPEIYFVTRAGDKK
ncbi:MAG: methyltransferase domain-containing protein [Actinobacteria bacterium]|nr:methyltransferase domain-containing protein [Actinomycetota bacterium]